MAKHFKNIRVPEEIHARIKVKAAQNKKSIVDFLDNQFPEDESMFSASINIKKPVREKGGELFEFPF